jgi:hypothetical protein
VGLGVIITHPSKLKSAATIITVQLLCHIRKLKGYEPEPAIQNCDPNIYSPDDQI